MSHTTQTVSFNILPNAFENAKTLKEKASLTIETKNLAKNCEQSRKSVDRSALNVSPNKAHQN